MLCNKCGKEIPDGSSFCNYCGNKVVISIEKDSKSSNYEKKMEVAKNLGDIGRTLTLLISLPLLIIFLVILIYSCSS